MCASTSTIAAQAESLVVALVSGDDRALGRAISLVENDAPETAAILAGCRSRLAIKPIGARRIGITGPPGAGKSTLVGALAVTLAQQGHRVGIVAVDPSSVVTGGALLGDRIRMDEAEQAGADIYMRSMAARGHLGGLARATDAVLTLIEASGRDMLLIETTGVGQGEIEVVQLADCVAVVLVPGMGDGIQALKAGILEIASLYILNKADRDGIDRLEQEMRALESFSPARAPRPILRTVATSGQGIDALLATILAYAPLPRSVAGTTESVNSSSRQSVAGHAFFAGTATHIATFDKPVLDHLGIAVASLDAASHLYQALGVPLTARETIAGEQVRLAMYAVGDARIELLEPTHPDSAIARFLTKRGEGLHHIALRVPDLAATVAALLAQGVRLVDTEIKTGAGGHRYVFLHPSAASGVLVELVEAPCPQPISVASGDPT